MAQENIKVYARIRPSSSTIQSTSTSTLCLKTDPTTSTIVATGKDGKNKSFRVSQIFGQGSSQESIYNDVGRSAVNGFLDGMNGTIFAYGQTGSGKTFTMLGLEGDEFHRGIIPRAIEEIFATLQAKQEKASDTFKFTMKVMFLELYNEKLFDLLDFKKNASIKIQQGRTGGTILGASDMDVKSAEGCMELLKKGWNQRKVAETEMNHQSSRSHAIFVLSLVTETTSGSIINRKESRLNLVDLAGSERQSQTNNGGQRLKEAGSINNTLSVLARVIRTISEANPRQHISFRDSLLTQLLRDSLGGNSRTSVIVNIHPNLAFVDDTISTLTFAESVQKIKTVAKVNSTLTFFQKVNNQMDETMKKVRELEDQQLIIRQNVLSYFENVLASLT